MFRAIRQNKMQKIQETSLQYTLISSVHHHSVGHFNS